jgi:hypothetical protein
VTEEQRKTCLVRHRREAREACNLDPSYELKRERNKVEVFNGSLTLSRFFGPERLKPRAMLMTRTAAPERSNEFARSNFEPSAPKHEAVRATVSRPERSFGAANHELLNLIERAIARIQQGEGAQAALRDMSTTLLGLRAMIMHDPGIKMAADDLYDAAAALVAGQSGVPETVDVRRWRLLREADARLRTRLASAQPSEKAKLLGLN